MFNFEKNLSATKECINNVNVGDQIAFNLINMHREYMQGIVVGIAEELDSRWIIVSLSSYDDDICYIESYKDLSSYLNIKWINNIDKYKNTIYFNTLNAVILKIISRN